MLYTYSPRALDNNWLNQTIVEMLASGMRAILEGGAAPEWPNIIPDMHRVKLEGRNGIRDRLQHFWENFESLERPAKEDLLDALEQQSSLPQVLYDGSVCTRINVFPEEVKCAVTDLFKFLFEKQLVTLKVDDVCLRDLHYNIIYEDLPERICPFCGLGYFRAPGAPRHALDHFMPISKYPFVGADFRNLLPMCHECNSDFKKVTDVLWDEDGRRRRCIDPYNGPTFRVCLDQSIPFSGMVKNGIRLPKWVISFRDGPQEEAENWDRVFKIRERYERDVLNAEFRYWLEEFAHWYIGGQHGSCESEDIVASIPQYVESVIQSKMADRAFLKREVFMLLWSESFHPERGDEMHSFLRILVHTHMG